MAKLPAAATESAAGANPSDKKVPKTLLVLDTTATNESGKRTHDMIVNGAKTPIVFEPGVPRALPLELAFRFLHHDAFWLVDENGARQDYQRRPKQPDELQAGEALVLSDHETVARYDELSSPALLQRVLEMPGSEKFAAGNPNRAAIIRFIVDHKTKVKAETTSKARDIGRDEFVPEAEFEDEAEAA